MWPPTPVDLLPHPGTRPGSPPPPDPPTLPSKGGTGGRRRPPSGPDLATRRVRRNRRIWAVSLLVLALALGLYFGTSGGGPSTPVAGHTTPTAHGGTAPTPAKNPRLDPDWDGNGKPVTLAFGGDVNFPSDSNLGNRLAADPATALGTTVPALLSGANLTMANFESALTNGTCPDSQSKQFVFYASSAAVTALTSAGIDVITNTNNHGMDCGAAGLQMALGIKQQVTLPILGIGQNAAQAFTPYTTTIDGEKIAIIAATQVIDSDLQTAWTATATQPGLASAYQVDELVAAVEAARKTADTVVVYLHWGTETDTCPNPVQEPLAEVLVKAGADIIVGTHAHVLLGAGYLGTAFVDYGLGNFAFYDNSPPENQSGSLLVTATGRHITNVVWRPAVIVDDLPQPLSGAAATTALNSWNAARSCTNATATAGAPIATTATESAPADPSVVPQLSADSG